MAFEKKEVVRICKGCGRGFQRKSRSKYCSQACLMNHCLPTPEELSRAAEEVRALEAARRPYVVSRRMEGACTVYCLSPDGYLSREAERAQSERWRQEGIEEAERKRRTMEAEGWISSEDYRRDA